MIFDINIINRNVSKTEKIFLSYGYDFKAWKKFIRMHEIKKLFDELAQKDRCSLIMGDILFA